MRPTGKMKLGFYPLPSQEARRIRLHLEYPEKFAALDPCVGEGVAFHALVQNSGALSYGVEIDAHRAEQASGLGIQVMQADLFDVRCPAESLSLVYLNPPYDFEAGVEGNQRFELLFLEHTYRWLKAHGVLVFVIPRAQLKRCAKLLAAHFVNLRVYGLTEPECVQYGQVVVFGAKRGRSAHQPDTVLLARVESLARAAMDATGVPPLTEDGTIRYAVPASAEVALTNRGILLDQVEDLLPHSPAYRQASRVLIREQKNIRGRPLTPLHGGHVSLLATAGMLNGVFGEGDGRHIAHWRSLKFVDHWEEEEPNGAVVLHDRERFSHELTLVFVDGRTQILTHGETNETNEQP